MVDNDTKSLFMQQCRDIEMSSDSSRPQRDDEVEIDLEKSCNEEQRVEDPNEEDKDKVEDPKVGTEFNSIDEMYEYYSRYAKQSGFPVFKRNLKRGANGECKYVTFACSHSRKPKTKASNPLKL